MGNCFPSLTNFSKIKTLFKRKSKREDFTYLIDDDDETVAAQIPRRHILERIIDRYRKPQTMKRSIASILTSQLPLNYNRLFEIESSSSSQNPNDNNIQLQCLDAKALLLKQTNLLINDNNTTAVSTSSSSSLDLEWEHEYPDGCSLNPKTNDQMVSSNNNINNNNNNISMSSSSSSSSSAAVSPHLSSCHSRTSNSLEWWCDSIGTGGGGGGADGPEESYDYVDIDTENLLNEIDRLTKKALNETGMELL